MNHNLLEKTFTAFFLKLVNANYSLISFKKNKILILHSGNTEYYMYHIQDFTCTWRQTRAAWVNEHGYTVPPSLQANKYASVSGTTCMARVSVNYVSSCMSLITVLSSFVY